MRNAVQGKQKAQNETLTFITFLTALTAFFIASVTVHKAPNGKQWIIASESFYHEESEVC